MDLKKELKILGWIAAVFAFAFFLPIESARINTAITATLDLVKWYAKEHVILCLLPTFFCRCYSFFRQAGSLLEYESQMFN